VTTEVEAGTAVPAQPPDGALAPPGARRLVRTAGSLSGRLTPAVAVRLTLGVALALVVVLNSYGSLAVDTKPELYLAPWQSAAAYLSAWQANPQLGFPSFNVGLFPIAVVVGLIQTVGFGPALSVRVLRLLLLLLGGWGAARLYRALRPAAERGELGPLVAGVVFVANPYVVVAGGTQAILLPWALLPWQVLCLVRALRARPAGRWWVRWRWPAAFALTFFAMTGMNAGVVPLLQLAAVPVVVLVLRGTERLGWRETLSVVGRCALLSVAVSIYWLLPSLLALRAGGVVVQNSETLEGISGPSSFAEALRGLGIWPLYGSSQAGPWLPQYGGYLHDPAVVLASFVLPVLAGAAVVLVRGTRRRLGVALIAVAVPVMVGVFPPGAPTPFGRALRAVFDRVPATAAFRTTNKIGSLLVLGVSLLVAAGAVALYRRLRRRAPAGVRAAVVAAAAAVLVLATLPAWTGDLYTSTVDLPGYWKDAAAELNRGPADRRVWFVPGEVLSTYRWSQDRPDDLSTSLLDRPSLVRTVIPVTSPEAANLLAASDVQLHEGTLPPGALSTAARYLGVGDVLLRNDVVWEYTGGGRPQLMQDQINADAGLQPRGTFGRPGENTRSGRYPPVSAFEAALPPLQRYEVAGSRPIARTEGAAGTVLIGGDGFGLAPLTAAGLLAGNPTFRYLADLDPAEFGRLLAAGEVGRIVLTDTNRRRTTVAGRLGGSQGPLLPASADPDPTRTLFGPADQTVLAVAGGSATATDAGSAFGPLATSTAENAVDGDPATGWLFGDFHRAVGQSITIRFLGHEVRRVTVRVRRTGAAQISRVRVEVGGLSGVLDVDAAGTASLALPAPVTADSVRVTVLAVAGTGFNLVGIDEIEIPGVRLTRVARLPLTLDRLAAGIPAGDTPALDRTPVDIVLSRVRGTAMPDDDEEVALDRDFRLPVERSYRVYGLVRFAGSSESVLDRLAGAYGPVTAVSSSRLLDLPAVRASRAVDGDPSTGWAPSAPVVGQSLTITAPRRRIDHVDITQGARGAVDWVSRVRVAVDGRATAVAAIRPGTSRVRLPAVTGRSLRITVLATHSGSPTAAVRLSEVDFGGPRMRFSAARAAAACVPVAAVDGAPLLMRPVQPLTSTGPALWAGCDGGLRLGSGKHAVRAVPGWAPDELVLRDRLGDRPAPAAPPDGPRYDVTTGPGPRLRATVTGATGPYYLVTGQAYDARWRASLDGRDLGPPIVVDGYATGWRIDAPGTHTMTIRYGPQRVTDLALVASALAVLGCVAVLVLAAWRPGAAGETGGPGATGGTASLAAPAAATRRRSRRQERRGTRLRAAVGWLSVLVLAWAFGGPVLLGVAAATLVWHLLRRPAPRTVLWTAVAAFALVPLAWLAFRPGQVDPLTARIVQDNLWPHRLAAAGLLLLVVGAVRAERRRPR
jgi:arabinofuranan 3-O-arabinosyltransferase